MAAEEAKDPKRSIPAAYVIGILTLVLLAIGVMQFAGCAGDWTKLNNINDPLPQAMKMIVGDNSGWLHMLVRLGLFGLVASTHNIIIGYSLQIFALAREAYLPAYFSVLHPRFKNTTPRHSGGRGGWYCGDLPGRAHQNWRANADRQRRHHGGVWSHPDVHQEHAEPVQIAPH